MSSKSKPGSPLVPLLVPGCALLVLYAGYCAMFPSQQAKEIKALTARLQTLKAQEIPAAAKLQLTADIAAAEEKLQAKRSERDALRSAGGKLLQGKLSAVEQIQSQRRINEALRAAGLTSVAHAPVENRNARLLKSLDDSAKQLSKTLNDMAAKDPKDQNIAIPADLPPEVNPLEWLAEQRRMRRISTATTSGQASELQLVGDYRAMLAGLAEIKRSCPEAIVTSIAFEKPERRALAGNQLIWKLRLQLQSCPADETGSGAADEVIAHRTAKVPVSVASTRRGE